MSRRIERALVALALAVPSLAYAQATAKPAEPAPSTWRAAAVNLTRFESWSFFDPPPTGGNPDSQFVGNRLRVSLSRSWKRVDVAGSLQYVQFGGLPSRAIGPGFLGTGGLYYFHANSTTARGVFVPALNLRLKLPHGLTILGGRFGYTSGAESASGHPRIETIKRSRIDSRLVGDFEWSLFQRSFDGIRGDVDRRRWHASAAWLRPTQGGFENSAGTSLDGVDLGAFTLSARPGAVMPASETTAFSYVYSDDRLVTARPDNTGLAATRARITVTAIGGSVVGSARAGAVETDWLGWYAYQAGSWYGQSHRAQAFSLEGGVQRPKGWQPWLRTGYSYASGDGDPRDNRHETFFMMVPTVRRFAFTTIYAPMNLRETFVEFIVRPSTRLRARADVRRLWLADGADRWYSGSGATQRAGSFFGYAGRSSGGHTGLGTAVQGAADVTLGRHWSVNAFAGGMHGGRVVRTLFRGEWARFIYLESLIQF